MSQKRWQKKYRGTAVMPKVINWKHDNWTLYRIHKRLVKEKRNAHKARIVLCLVYLQAGISVERIAEMLGESRINIVGWAREYIKVDLQILLGLQVSLPILFRRKIEKYIKDHPKVLSQLLRLESEDDFEMYAEEMEVEGYALKNWVYELELGGNDARKAVGI